LTNSLGAETISEKQFSPVSASTAHKVSSKIQDLPVATNESLARNDSAVYDEGLPLSDSSASKSEKYKVTVTLTSLTMHNDHDPSLSGKGEIINYGFIQGHQLNLKMHIDSGKTKTFDPPKQITVYLGEMARLSIFTVGIESDFCPTGAKLAGDPPYYLTELIPIFGNPSLNWKDEITDIQLRFIEEYLTNGECYSERLGRINEVYEPTKFGLGLHSVKSSSGDFTLRYRINVEPIPAN
jgi:hypothetical protein